MQASHHCAVGITINIKQIVCLFALQLYMVFSMFLPTSDIVHQSGRRGHFTWNGCVVTSSVILDQKAYRRVTSTSVFCMVHTWASSRAGLILVQSWLTSEGDLKVFYCEMNLSRKAVSYAGLLSSVK